MHKTGAKYAGYKAYSGKILASILNGQNNVLFINQLSEIDKGVPHASECGVDTYIGNFGYFFEAHAGIMPQQYNLFLVFGQIINQRADVIMNLVSDDDFFGGYIREFP